MKTMTRIRRWLAVGLLFAVSPACLAQVAETVTYYYTNQQGTPLATADSSGNILSTADYRPYGSQVLGSPAGGPGYTGHVNDPDSGLVYMQARYYDPVGRMLSPDPNDVKAGDVFTFNRFAYANDNPVLNVDPDGRVVQMGGSPGNIAQFEKLAYRLTGIQTTTVNGNLAQVGNMNGKVGYAGAASALNDAINSSSTLSVNTVSNDPVTFGDSYFGNFTFDVADFNVFEGKSTQLAAALFTHLMVERLYDAQHRSGPLSRASFASAHNAALGPEAAVMGAAGRTDNFTPNKKGGGTVDLNYLDPSGNIMSKYSFTIDSSGAVHK